ncbi:MAG: hypothetical protein AAGD32_07015 [Planctomycetota bacterium]
MFNLATPKAHGFSRGSAKRLADPRLKAWALIVFACTLVGCGGDDAGEPGVIASFNGDEFAATEFMAAYEPAIRSQDNGNRPEKPTGIDTLTGRFRLIAKSGDRQGNGTEPAREFVLTVSGVDGPGTYPIIRGDQNIESFQLYAKDYAAGSLAAPVEYYAPVGDTQVGTLIIDELGPDAVGSFSFSIPSAGGEVAEITDGAFRIEDVLPASDE